MNEREASENRRNEIVRSYYLELAIAFPFIWFALLTVQAIRESSASIYVAMGWLAIPAALLIVSNALIRYVRIDFDKREVLIVDGIKIETRIPSGSLLKVTEWKGTYNLTLLQDGKEEIVKWKLISYTSKKRNKILSALYEFNPKAV